MLVIVSLCKAALELVMGEVVVPSCLIPAHLYLLSSSRLISCSAARLIFTLSMCFKPDHTKANTCIWHTASIKPIVLTRETAEISTCFMIVFILDKLFRPKRNSLESGYWSSPIKSLSKDTEIPLIPSRLLCTIPRIVFIMWGLKLLKIL